MALFEALCGRQCRSLVGWSEIGEIKILGRNLVQDALERVNRLLAAQSKQKAYMDHIWFDLEFLIGDMVILKVSQMKGTVKFGKKDKLSLRYIGSY